MEKMAHAFGQFLLKSILGVTLSLCPKQICEEKEILREKCVPSLTFTPPHTWPNHAIMRLSVSESSVNLKPQHGKLIRPSERAFQELLDDPTSTL